MVIERPSNEAGIKVVGKRTIRKRKAANSDESGLEGESGWVEQI